MGRMKDRMLRGELYNGADEEMLADFARALEELPHDWKTRVRLARALRVAGRDDDARREAEAVARLRERLDPAAITPRLTRADPTDLGSAGRRGEERRALTPLRASARLPPHGNGSHTLLRTVLDRARAYRGSPLRARA